MCYLFCDLVQGLGLLGEHVLGLVPLVPVPGPGALGVHVHCDHCHLMRGRDQGGRGSPGCDNGTCGSEKLEIVSHHYFSLVRLSLSRFSSGSFSARIIKL